MDPGQVALYAVFLLLTLFYGRRWLMTRSIPQYTPELARERVRSGGSVLVDVRTPAERSRRSIPGSMHIPLHELGRRIGELEQWKAKEIIFYCATGSRSLVAAAKARSTGFTVANLSGGMSGWEFSGR